MSNLDALDPDLFVLAWERAQEMGDPLNTTPLVPVGTVSPDLAKLANDPKLRWVLAVSEVFPNSNLASNCTFRILAALTLIQDGGLGPFFHKEYGIWSDAIPVLAVARCDSAMGFDRTDLDARLALIPPPPTA